MKNSAAVSAAFFVRAICVLGTVLSACSPSPTGTDLVGTPLLKKGSRPLAFDYEQVSELLIIKNDPLSGDAWSARLTRTDLKAPDWKVGPSNGAQRELVDHAADGFLVLHLLDTLRTLEVESLAPPTAIDIAGLSPPRFALRWSWQGKFFEARIGATDSKTGATFAQLTEGGPLVLVRGATIAMLGYLTSFDSVRLKTWVGLQADEVDQIQIRRGGREVFYAQREGVQWTRRDHRPIRALTGTQVDIGKRLEAIAHLRIKSFVDDPEQASRLAQELARDRHPEVDVILTERQGRARNLTASLINQKLFAKNSAREGGIFEIHRDSLRFFTIPGK